jgi:DNA primase
VGAVVEQAGDAVAGLVNELAVAPLPEDREDAIARFVADVVRALQDLGLTRRIADAKSRLQRLDPGAEPDAYRDTFEALLAMEAQRRTLRESA